MGKSAEVWVNSQGVLINMVSAIKRGIYKLGRARAAPASILVSATERELSHVALRSHEILFKAKTVFPFDLFPDTVIIDREKLTFIEKDFFFIGRTISVPIRDILNVEVDTGPFFGSVKMTSRYFFTNPQSIRFLWRSHAIKLQRLLQGHIIAHEREIDCRDIEKDHLERLLLDLGQAHAK